MLKLLCLNEAWNLSSNSFCIQFQAASPTKGLAAEPSPSSIRRYSADKRASTLPGATTPGAATPGAITPGAFTPDGIVPGLTTPGAITPGAESDTSIESGIRRDLAAAFLLPSPGTPTSSFNGGVNGRFKFVNLSGMNLCSNWHGS